MSHEFYGKSPPPTTVIVPSSFLPVAAHFGEFDFVARGAFRAWFHAAASREHEIIWLWGLPPTQEALLCCLRQAARNPLAENTLAEFLTQERYGVLRINRNAPPIRKWIGGALSFLSGRWPDLSRQIAQRAFMHVADAK